MSAKSAVVFLVDVDNTLLDNDRITAVVDLGPISLEMEVRFH